ncbi:hypothetical protein FBU30_004772 [Linnemannia zychae]|nr:hypothetical protein FBU30_004772 [Linnemannia zychae]
MPVMHSGRRNSTNSRAHLNSYSFATITLPKTMNNRNLDGYDHMASDIPNLIQRNRSLSSAGSAADAGLAMTSIATAASGAGSAAIPLAPIITAIQRGNFLALSDSLLDLLIRSMAGKNSTALETINISGAAISAADAKLLGRLIRSSDAANIKTLKLAQNGISQQAVKYLFEAWKYNTTITSLSLARSGINDKTIKYISKMLTRNETLRELDLSSNRITAAGLELLVESLTNNRKLTRLNLQSNNIKRAGASILARLLTKNRILRHLNAGSNGLGSEGCATIANAVRFNRALYSLSLDMNEMGPSGAAAMATALVSNRHLTYVYLPHNNIGDEGLEKICESLKRNKTLIGLDLELNNIGSGQNTAGMVALAEVLKVNRTLREINLAYNTFSGDAISELMKGVAVNSTLESINFINCGISTEGAIAIAEILPSARGLQNLGLTSNPDIAVEGYWALSNNLAKNRSMKGIQLDYNSEDRQALYEAMQKFLTRNFIWQQAIYAAACRILLLSRVVLLGRPAKRYLLESQIQQQQQQQGKGAWSLLKRKVRLVRTSSSNSYSSLLSTHRNHVMNEAHSGGSASPLLLAVESKSRAAAGNQEGRETSGSAQIYAYSDRPPTPFSLGSPNNSLGVDKDLRFGLGLGSLGRTGSSTNVYCNLDTPATHQQHRQPIDQDYMLGGSVAHISSTHSATPSTPSSYNEEYNAHKVMANLGNMPYEIFETICAFLDPGHTMTIAQIRTTIQLAGDRSTLVKYYTKDLMLERIFQTRYIPPFGVRYSVKNGDERI